MSLIYFLLELAQIAPLHAWQPRVRPLLAVNALGDAAPCRVRIFGVFSTSYRFFLRKLRRILRFFEVRRLPHAFLIGIENFAIRLIRLRVKHPSGLRTLSLPTATTLLFEHGWRVVANSFDSFYRLLAVQFPVINIVMRILVLQPVQHSFVFLHYSALCLHP